MCSEQDIWNDYLRLLEIVMTRFKSDSGYDAKDDIDHLYRYENEPAIDAEIVDFTAGITCEIGGFPGYYADVLSLAKRRATQKEFLEYMNS
ncbi:MAG: hypothetical protein AAF382_17770 [Pseudomonadota bacterium]